MTATSGEETTVDRMVPGDLFGEISLLTGAPRTASIVAATEAVLYEMRKEDIDPLLRRRPELGAPLAALMAERQHLNLGRMQALERAMVRAQPVQQNDVRRPVRSPAASLARERRPRHPASSPRNTYCRMPPWR